MSTGNVLCEGWGLLQSGQTMENLSAMIIEQHYSQRRRQGRDAKRIDVVEKAEVAYHNIDRLVAAHGVSYGGRQGTLDAVHAAVGKNPM